MLAEVHLHLPAKAVHLPAEAAQRAIWTLPSLREEEKGGRIGRGQ